MWEKDIPTKAWFRIPVNNVHVPLSSARLVSGKLSWPIFWRKSWWSCVRRTVSFSLSVWWWSFECCTYVKRWMDGVFVVVVSVIVANTPICFWRAKCTWCQHRRGGAFYEGPCWKRTFIHDNKPMNVTIKGSCVCQGTSRRSARV